MSVCLNNDVMQEELSDERMESECSAFLKADEKKNKIIGERPVSFINYIHFTI